MIEGDRFSIVEMMEGDRFSIVEMMEGDRFSIVEMMEGDRLTLTEYFNWVNSVGLSQNGQTLPTGSDDKTIKLWRLRY